MNAFLDADNADEFTAVSFASNCESKDVWKAFLYAQAIAEKRLTAASLLEDAPTHINTGSGLYIPQNYDRQFRGWVSVLKYKDSLLSLSRLKWPDLIGNIYLFTALGHVTTWRSPLVQNVQLAHYVIIN